jgi:hypothetical protein
MHKQMVDVFPACMYHDVSGQLVKRGNVAKGLDSPLSRIS